MSAFYDQLTDAMTWLGQQPDTIFVGQAVEVPGVFMHNTLKNVPAEKKLEFPVAESFQMQFCIGLALDGLVPICIFPRQNFLMLAMADLFTLNHIPAITKRKVIPKMIVRTADGMDRPSHPGHQHIGDYREQLISMLPNYYSAYISSADDDPLDTYKRAYASKYPALVFERGNAYTEG